MEETVGNRAKFMTQSAHYIELPDSFVKKYQHDYFINKQDGKYCLDIASKTESKYRDEIIDDLHKIIKKEDIEHPVLAIEFYEDGMVVAIDLTSTEKKILYYD